MRIYEELFIVKPDAPEEESDQLIEQLRTQLTSAGATVDKIDKWGKRRLAYEIRKQREGTYAVIECAATPAVVKEFERQLGLNEQVLRSLSTRIPPRKRVRSAPKQPPAAVEEVV